MTSGARTPEELETLLEDAFLVRDGDAVTDLFEDGAVLAAGAAALEARGGEAIARLVTALWARECTYVAAPHRVLQARDTTLVVADGAVNVVRRGSDGRWRYAIAVLNLDEEKNR